MGFRMLSVCETRYYLWLSFFFDYGWSVDVTCSLDVTAPAELALYAKCIHRFTYYYYYNYYDYHDYHVIQHSSQPDEFSSRVLHQNSHLLSIEMVFQAFSCFGGMKTSCCCMYTNLLCTNSFLWLPLCCAHSWTKWVGQRCLTDAVFFFLNTCLSSYLYVVRVCVCWCVCDLLPTYTSTYNGLIVSSQCRII